MIEAPLPIERIFVIDQALGEQPGDLVQNRFHHRILEEPANWLYRYEPMLISAPGVQGKTSILQMIDSSLSTGLCGPVKVVWIKPPRKSSSQRRSLARWIARYLRCHLADPTQIPIDFEELLSKSDVIKKNKSNGTATLLVIDPEGCSSTDALSWLFHSVAMSGDGFRGAAAHMQVQVLLAGNREFQMLPGEQRSKYDFPHVVIRNFSALEVDHLYSSICSRAREFGQLEILDNARERLYHHTTGDKYFTQLLGAESVRLAQTGRAVGPGVIVRADDVDLAAEHLRSGRIIDRRVMPLLTEMLANHPHMGDVVLQLIAEGSAIWSSRFMRSADQLLLFESGAVGLAETPHTEPAIDKTTLPPSTGTPKEKSRTADAVLQLGPEESLEARDPRYQVRNPMMADYLQNVICARRGVARYADPNLNLHMSRILKEEETFLKKQDQLRKTHPGKFVALQGGLVLDADADRFALGRRMSRDFPAQVILIRSVDWNDEPEEMGSPE